MGLFSNPDCPRCGRETTVDTDGLTNFYTCIPCRMQLRKEKEEREKDKKRISDLEDRISKLEGK